MQQLRQTTVDTLELASMPAVVRNAMEMLAACRLFAFVYVMLLSKGSQPGAAKTAAMQRAADLMVKGIPDEEERARKAKELKEEFDTVLPTFHKFVVEGNQVRVAPQENAPAKS